MSSSSRKPSTGGQRSDGSALRKDVLKRNMRRAAAERGLLRTTPARSASPSVTRPTAVFEMTEDLRIQMTRVVRVTATHVNIFNAICIFHDSMDKEQYERELLRQESVSRKQSFRDQRPAEDNPMERISQMVRYSQRSVYIERDVAIDKKYLDSVWRTSDCRGVMDAFKTALSDGRQSLADVNTTSMSSNSPKGGFKSSTAIVITFNQDANSPDPAKLAKDSFMRKEDASCPKDGILMNATVRQTGFGLNILQEVHLKPAVWLFRDDAWVEEQRLYRYSPVEQKMIELHKSFKRSPSVKSLPSATPVMRVPERASSLSPASSNKRSSASLSLDHLLTPKTELEVTKKASPAPQKHTLTMAAEIGGEVHEFQGNIVFGPKMGPQELKAKRLLVDGKELWKDSTDWNPSSYSNSMMAMPKMVKK